MFIQIIQGHVTDPAAMREAFEQWQRDLAPGAEGWLGGTAGITGDDTFFASACFASAAEARRNSERPEQHQWWMETAKYFSGEVAFHDCERGEVFPEGKTDFFPDAGFVQVMQGRLRDPDKVTALMHRMEGDMREWRPDLLGAVLAIHPAGDAYTQFTYFTSEPEARENESKEPPERLRGVMDELMGLEVGEPVYHDLREHWTDAP
ncbi:hypothetical protein [Actinocorallia populi]|uniref:hypothetical protein n=1 Tax=Actinocorallia populi TaxID=2079200 RepID=UPI000D090C88|nr:hypothetical protein [Actinocorallia populi]